MVPLSGGDVVDGLVWSAGGGVLCIEFVELSAGGVAGAVDDESAGAFGEVDCCLEQATMANALRHNIRRLRFMELPHCMSGTTPPRLGGPSSQCRVHINARVARPVPASPADAELGAKLRPAVVTFSGATAQDALESLICSTVVRPKGRPYDTRSDYRMG